jgi:hypothetical protein
MQLGGQLASLKQRVPAAMLQQLMHRCSGWARWSTTAKRV